MAVDAYVETMFGIEKQIKIFTAKIASISKEDERVRLLMTIPGIDYITALTIVPEIVDIKKSAHLFEIIVYPRIFQYLSLLVHHSYLQIVLV